RYDQGRFWWELRACAYYYAFEYPKIIWPRNVPPTEMRFGRDEEGSLLNDKGYFIYGVNSRVLAILNSTLMLWFADKLTTKLRGGWLELKGDTVVGRLPVINVDRLSSVDSLLDTRAEILGLDDLINEAYGLT